MSEAIRPGFLCPLVAALASASALAQVPQPPPRSPPDISGYVTPEQLEALEKAMKPHVEEAQRTFPAVRARFLAGLKPGQSLYVTTRLYDERTWSELASVAVTRIEADIIDGRIWSRPKLVDTHRFRDRYAFPEVHLVDWVIVNPDGTEEGNFVGRLLRLPR